MAVLRLFTGSGHPRCAESADSEPAKGLRRGFRRLKLRGPCGRQRGCFVHPPVRRGGGCRATRKAKGIARGA